MAAFERIRMQLQRIGADVTQNHDVETPELIQCRRKRRQAIFADEEAANAADPVLTSVPAGRRSTLIAPRVDDGAIAVYRFDIRYQGDDETVFFDV